ncbi:MAG: HEAT repeat domain-containing protein [Candidatus Heimdallarchaeota archaeon]
MNGSREKGKKTIREVLKKKDKNLSDRLETIWKKAWELQERQKSEQGHQQGRLHCKEVEKNLDRLIPDKEKKKFEAYELFFLSVAACLHDAGKSEESEEDHGVLAMNAIKKNFKDFLLIDKNEADFVGGIVGAHTNDNVFNSLQDRPIDSVDIRLRFLAALFRLADMLHTYCSRTPQIIIGENKNNEPKTIYRKCLSGWEFKDSKTINLVTIELELEELERVNNILTTGTAMMQQELNVVSEVLWKENYPTKIELRLIAPSKPGKIKRTLLGMDFYSENEAEIFKGRDDEIENLSNAILTSPLTILYGKSGIGKTSIIQAGLTPKLRKLSWEVYIVRPLKPNLRKKIYTQIIAQKNKLMGEIEPTSSLQEILKKIAEKREVKYCNSLLVIDQFEDFLSVEEKEKEEMANALVRVTAAEKISKNYPRVLLSFRVEYVTEIEKYLSDNGIINYERIPLEGLEKNKLDEVSKSIFEANKKTISEELLKTISSDLEKTAPNSKYIYPPFVQIITNIMIEKMEGQKDKKKTPEEIYSSLGPIEQIIANYLLQSLEKIGEKGSENREMVEKILKELTINQRKNQKSKEELLKKTGMKEDTLKKLLEKLTAMRLIRQLQGGEQYELIHDCLAKEVEEQLVSEEEKQLQAVKAVLETKARNYEKIGSLLTPNEMMLLYKRREEVKLTTEEKELMLASCLAEQGPAWWFFRKERKEELTKMLIKAVKQRKSRKKAITFIANIRTKEALPTLQKAIENENWEVREAAAEALGKIGTPAAEEALLTAIKKDKDWEVRAAAAEALGKIGTPAAVKALQKAIKKDKDWEVRAVAAEALGTIGTPAAVKALQKAIKKDKGWEVRAAAEALGAIGTEKALTALQTALKSRHLLVRVAAAEALGKIGTEKALTALQKAIENENWEVREAAAEALGKIGTEKALTALQTAIKEDKDELVRRAAAEALGTIGTPAAEEALLTAIKEDEEQEVRAAAAAAAAKALGAIGTEKAVTALLRLIKEDKDKWVRRAAAVEALGAIGTEKAVTALLRLIKEDKVPWVRAAAVEALGAIGTEKALTALLRLIKEDKDKWVRRAAAKALGAIGTEKALTALQTAIKEDRDEDVRVAAAKALGAIGTEKALTALLTAIKEDKVLWVREAAVEALGAIEIGKTLSKLIKDYLSNEITNREWLQAIIYLDEKLYCPLLKEEPAT